MTPNDTDLDFDVIIIGSGFGGSVSALRLSEKGYRVAVLEAGARFKDEDFAVTNFDVKKYLFNPAMGCYGIQRITAVRDSLILAGAGVGGGSLVYANTLYEPLEAFYRDKQWRDITDWKTELAPYYDQAKRMLGVVENPYRTASDDVMEKVANDLGVGDTFHPTPVGVFFGGPNAKADEHVPDPYFGGAGPDRNPCRQCGECMTGCRYNSKNTLVKNYLHLAEAKGASVLPLCTVTRIKPRDGGGYDVTFKFTKAKRATARTTRTLSAEHVVMAAAAITTCSADRVRVVLDVARRALVNLNVTSYPPSSRGRTRVTAHSGRNVAPWASARCRKFFTSVFFALYRHPVMHSPHCRHGFRSGPAPPKYGSGTCRSASAPGPPKNTPTGVGWKVSPTPSSRATFSMTSSAGVR